MADTILQFTPRYTAFVKSVIVGTAGHIDHGKTSLVKALTGIDADRLEEEKRRGITIDLGFAHLELTGFNGEKLRLGFVDVPGHERFVRNMLAGAGGMDIVLFVVAADEGVMPQTREHFDICRMLGIERGITVVTKSDLVNAEELAALKQDLGGFLKDSFLDPARAPMVAVSTKSGAGLNDLKAALGTVAAAAPTRDADSFLRLPIDRVFAMKGFGTVITGTLIAGRVRKEDEVEVFPGGERLRVRGVQVHDQTVDEARAGQRTALNLASVEKEELARGMMLARPGTFRATDRVDVSLTLLADAKPLKDRARVHFHCYTAETIAEVRLHETKQLAPGESGFAQLRLAQAAVLLPGDRFIVRQFSPVVTIGGGLVLDNAPERRRSDGDESFLKILSRGDLYSMLKIRVARRVDHGISLQALIAETGMRPEEIAKLLEPDIAKNSIVRLGDLFVHGPNLFGLGLYMLETVTTFHRDNPLASGISKEQLREQLGLSLPKDVFAAALDRLSGENKLRVSGELVALAGRTVTMKDDEAESKSTIEKAFAAAGLKVPALKDVLAGVKVDKVRAQKIVVLLLREGTLVKLSDDLVFHRDALGGLKKSLAVQKVKSEKLDVARFKEMTGISRKYAIPLLEWLDRERVTRRVGDARVIL
jgi:selenocysteine-specific elongation factor